MEYEIVTKAPFAVIGKEGSTDMGPNFIQALWNDANSHFSEVEPLAKRNPDGTLAGIWGAMSDFSRSFRPWQDDFSKGLYLAGVECEDDAEAPEGWTRWDIPGFTFLKFPGTEGFNRGLEVLKENGYSMAGAAQDYTDPRTGEGFVLFPLEI